ncbi:MAG TPA: hypothetical protein VFS59_16210 [Gemmatimonadaceae bacterium]|nr:hypothetical protein [Gemmatimonadaceae bacterium]
MYLASGSVLVAVEEGVLTVVARGGGTRQMRVSTPTGSDGDAFETFFSTNGDKLFYRSGRGVMQVPLTVSGDRMTIGRPAMYVEFAFADFLGRGYELGSDDRLLVKLLPSTAPQSEIRVMTGRR